MSGSFKDRGANNKIIKLKEEDEASLRKGLTTASSGNHALACVRFVYLLLDVHHKQLRLGRDGHLLNQWGGLAQWLS